MLQYLQYNVHESYTYLPVLVSLVCVLGSLVTIKTSRHFKVKDPKFKRKLVYTENIYEV